MGMGGPMSQTAVGLPFVYNTAITDTNAHTYRGANLGNTDSFWGRTWPLKWAQVKIRSTLDQAADITIAGGIAGATPGVQLDIGDAIRVAAGSYESRVINLDEYPVYYLQFTVQCPVAPLSGEIHIMVNGVLR